MLELNKHSVERRARQMFENARTGARRNLTWLTITDAERLDWLAKAETIERSIVEALNRKSTEGDR